MKKGNHFLYIDSDVVIEKDMIQNLVVRLDIDSKTGIVTPMILYLSDKNWVNQAGANVDLLTGKVSVGWGPKKDFLIPKEVQNSGTVMLMKNKVVEKIGAFEDWFMCYFDPDYCLRARKEGFSMWYEPGAIAYHDQSKNENIWRPRVLSRAYLLGRNRTLFMRKHGQNIFAYILFVPLLFGYYLLESLRFGIFPKWLELVFGTAVGFFYPLKKGNFIKLPKAESYQYELLNTTKESFLDRIMINVPFSYLWLFKRSLGDPKTILDLGCGDGSFIKVLTRGKKCKIIGVDIFKEVVDRARLSGAYQTVIQGDVVEVAQKMVDQKKRFDTVFSCQLIEHMSEKEGNRMLDLMDKLAINRSVVATPHGFVEAEDLSGHNPHRHHISGWTVNKFSQKGFTVHGLGFKYGLPKSGISKVSNKLIAYIYMARSILFAPLVYFIPSLGAGILAIKKYENNGLFKT